MKIFETLDFDGGVSIRLQLKDLKNNVMLFDFTIEKEAFPELRRHIIAHLNSYEVPK